MVSTSLNDDSIKDSFWQENKKKSTGLFSRSNKGYIENNGIEGLDRFIRSNKITPEIITDYTKIVLKNRLEILLGLEGEGDLAKKQYTVIQERYPQILELADKYYDMVIVDLDKQLNTSSKVQILKRSDIVVAMTSQKVKSIQQIVNKINTGDVINEQKTVMTIGKYMDDTKYNAKNITRNVLRKREIINTIPYNNLLFEATQEGKVVDLYFNFIRLKEKDANYFFVKEIKRLYAEIKGKIELLQMNIKM